MRRAVLVTLVATGLALGGTAVASAKDDERLVSPGAGAPAFELEIDPELDAAFGPRPVGAVQAAAVLQRAFPGARVTEAELDEEDGGPVWDMTFELGGREREAVVDAVTGDLR